MKKDMFADLAGWGMDLSAVPVEGLVPSPDGGVHAKACAAGVPGAVGAPVRTMADLMDQHRCACLTDERSIQRGDLGVFASITHSVWNDLLMHSDRGFELVPGHDDVIYEVLTADVETIGDARLTIISNWESHREQRGSSEVMEAVGTALVDLVERFATITRADLLEHADAIDHQLLLTLLHTTLRALPEQLVAPSLRPGIRAMLEDEAARPGELLVVLDVPMFASSVGVGGSVLTELYPVLAPVRRVGEYGDAVNRHVMRVPRSRWVLLGNDLEGHPAQVAEIAPTDDAAVIEAAMVLLNDGGAFERLDDALEAARAL